MDGEEDSKSPEGKGEEWEDVDVEDEGASSGEEGDSKVGPKSTSEASFSVITEEGKKE